MTNKEGSSIVQDYGPFALALILVLQVLIIIGISDIQKKIIRTEAPPSVSSSVSDTVSPSSLAATPVSTDTEVNCQTAPEFEKIALKNFRAVESRGYSMQPEYNKVLAEQGNLALGLANLGYSRCEPHR
ncbi:MAG: hypothetical protein Q8P54_02460 [bacterium]|nr:hypothetical protein [bacterium]